MELTKRKSREIEIKPDINPSFSYQGELIIGSYMNEYKVLEVRKIEEDDFCDTILIKIEEV